MTKSWLTMMITTAMKGHGQMIELLDERRDGTCGGIALDGSNIKVGSEWTELIILQE